jgi:hypothetical protein
VVSPEPIDKFGVDKDNWDNEKERIKFGVRNLVCPNHLGKNRNLQRAPDNKAARHEKERECKIKNFESKFRFNAP